MTKNRPAFRNLVVEPAHEQLGVGVAIVIPERGLGSHDGFAGFAEGGLPFGEFCVGVGEHLLGDVVGADVVGGFGDPVFEFLDVVLVGLPFEVEEDVGEVGLFGEDVLDAVDLPVCVEDLRINLSDAVLNFLYVVLYHLHLCLVLFAHSFQHTLFNRGHQRRQSLVNLGYVLFESFAFTLKHAPQ